MRVNKVREAAGPDQDMIGYVIQTGLPEKKAAAEYSLITITLTDRETGEMGEGSFSLINPHPDWVRSFAPDTLQVRLLPDEVRFQFSARDTITRMDGLRA